MGFMKFASQKHVDRDVSLRGTWLRFVCGEGGSVW